MTAVLKLHLTALSVFLILVVPRVLGQSKSPSCSQCVEWNQPQSPFKIFGNTYYVGTHGLSAILITSKSGHILIDGDLPESVPLIRASVQQLGFRIEDVKIILNSHVHFDHAGGIAELQRLSGAEVVASEWSAAVMKAGGVSKEDPQYGLISPIRPVRNVKTVRDGETVRVGGSELTAHLTPGHTPGGTSWTWQSCEGNVCHTIVYAESLSPVSAASFRFTDHPVLLKGFEKSFAFLDSTPCDIVITTHPEASDLWERLAKREHGSSDALVNSGACRQLANHGREQLRKRLEEERRSSERK